MIVSEKHKALLLKLRDPKRVLATIPHAKVIQYKNQPIVAVPHRYDEVKVLRNMGVKAPEPIRNYYGWPRNVVSVEDPFHAQIETAAFLTMNPRAYVLNGLGSGKTLAALWAFDYLREQGILNRLLVVTTLSTIEDVWADAVFEHFPHLEAAVVHNPNRARRIKILNEPADVYITNHDGIKIIDDLLASRGDIALLVVDELSECARNAQTDRWKALNTVVNKQTALINNVKAKRWVWGMTATPTPNQPTDAWAQCRLVTPDSVPKSFVRFRERVMKKVGPYLWVPRHNAMDMVYDAMQPAIRFKREECIDLPPMTYTERFVPLTKEQAKCYKEMEDTLHVEYEDGSITACNQAVKGGKLIQICCGILYGEDGTQVIPCEPRIEETLKAVNESETKTIVFCPFVAVVDHVAEALKKLGIKVGVIHGGVSSGARAQIFRGFQKGSEYDVLVAQPAAMAHGLTLTAASTIVWFAPIYDAGIYEQANGRIPRASQKHNMLVINIYGSPLEKAIYQRLKHRQGVQNLLLEMIRASRAA